VLALARVNFTVRLLPMTDAEKKNQYLSDVDAFLAPRFFHRRKHGNEWRHRIDDRNELWVHINFGLAVVNPSFGVTYLDFDGLLSKDVRSVSGTMVMLSSVTPPLRGYLIDEGADRVVQDLLDYGLPFLSRLANRAFAIERLSSATVRDWPVTSYSHRIRLLPLLLAAEQRVAEACQCLNAFLAEALPRDQIIPQYDVFATALADRFAC
jgi:hypothetical protein